MKGGLSPRSGREGMPSGPGLPATPTLLCPVPPECEAAGWQLAPAGHVVEEPLHPGVPAPLHGPAFLRASHFQLVFDRHPDSSTVVSSHRFNYPPRWGTYLREPILPPACAGVLNQDMGYPSETRPEYLTSYPAWPLAVRPDVGPPTSHLQMHADPRHHVLTSTTHESYAPPPALRPNQPRRMDTWDDDIPGGDKEKVPLPPSLYQHSYPAHKGLSSAVRAPSQHLGSDSTLRGDGHAYFDSSYRSQYMGEWAPPPKRCHEGLVSIVFGDPRCHNALTEHRRAYPALHHADLGCYDAARAARQVFRTQIPAGDGQRRFTTTMKKAFQQKEAGGTSISYPWRNMSSILQGDPGAQRSKANMTTSSLSYQEPSIADLTPRQPGSLGCHSTVCLGDGRLGSFSTTQQSDYRQPPQTHKVYPKSSDQMKSRVSFNFPDTDNTTTTQDMLVPHPPQKHPMPEELMQKIKHSHLVQPWQGRRWFSTEQREAYTDKYGGPVVLVVGDPQHSSVPLGTMKTFQHRPTWPPGNQARETHAQSNKYTLSVST